MPASRSSSLRFVLAIAGLLLWVAPARADSISFFEIFDLQQTLWIDGEVLSEDEFSDLGVELPLFDPSQGTLTGVKVTLDSNFEMSINLYVNGGLNGAEGNASPTRLTAFTQSGHSNIVDIGNLTGRKRPETAAQYERERIFSRAEETLAVHRLLLA